MFNLGMGEITVILLLALIFLGPKKLPDLASGLGKIIRDIRKATSDVKNEIALDDTFRKPFEELRDAVTLHPEELKRRDEIKKSLDETRRKLEESEAAATEEMTPLPDSDLGSSAPPSSSTPPPPVSMPPPPPAPVSGAAPRTSSVISSAPAPAGPAPSSPPPASVPAFPTAPPAGTFARQPPAPRPRLGQPRVTPPISMLASDEANKTQSLSEADLLPPPTPAPAAVPPPLPGIGKPPPPPPGMSRPPSGPGTKKA